MVPVATRKARAEIYKFGDGYLVMQAGTTVSSPIHLLPLCPRLPGLLLASLQSLTPSWGFQQRGDLEAYCWLLARHGYRCFLRLPC